jgi:O-glycosyl hydrolase
VAASFVPVIYDKETKRVLRWATLDYDRQLSDPAFNPADESEAVLRIPAHTYANFGRWQRDIPLLNQLQAYVKACT